ncbi:SMI1/KNR4 family protein [Chitinophaga silvisoli]|uniref:Knr4/Smi1-like domain-containing protein n=1 Tax=Chitinophaga silvisoli TaxID=2291814 RepID=A0A3E1NXD9_9BACT|nr:SMI1/KNR4 family protein [Chitinophaga silvisoli]RFM32582.1 hypothetical protein DXN04_23170 [Chitinophaga silvisoli]
MGIKKLLDRIVNFYIDRGIYDMSALNSGLTLEEIHDKITSLGINFPQDLYELYNWRNGFNVYEPGFDLWPSVSFLPLEKAIKDYTSVTKNMYDNLFTVFLENDSDRYMVNLASGDDYGKIFYDCPPITLTEYPVSIFDSLEKALVTQLECLEKGIYIFDDGRFVATDEIVDVIKNHNPNSDFYKYE